MMIPQNGAEGRSGSHGGDSGSNGGGGGDRGGGDGGGESCSRL